MTTAYDKADWHDDGAAAAGQPVDRAFTHIGLYLAWLIRHDLHNPDFIRSDWAAAVNAGEMTGSDLSAAVDGALVSDLMNAEGRAFSDAYRSWRSWASRSWPWTAGSASPNSR